MDRRHALRISFPASIVSSLPIFGNVPKPWLHCIMGFRFCQHFFRLFGQFSSVFFIASSFTLFHPLHNAVFRPNRTTESKNLNVLCTELTENEAFLLILPTKKRPFKERTFHARSIRQDPVHPPGPPAPQGCCHSLPVPEPADPSAPDSDQLAPPDTWSSPPPWRR